MLVACRSAVLYSTHISNTQMQAEQLFLSTFAGKTIFLKEGFTMKKDGYYSSGEFARMAHVTLRTIRYYDKQNILKPSYVTESGARFYTDEDFARLSQILLLKYLGFSLDDIREMTIDDSDYHFMENSLNIQLKLVRDRIEQMQLVEKAIQDTTDAIRSHHAIDWNQMLDLIHLTGMEKSMKNQYQNASNISSRINLHSLYSQNKQGWFPWVYEQCQIHPGMRILELAATVFCGHRIFPASPVKFPLLFLIFHPECFVMPDVLSDAKTAVFPSRHLTVQEFLMKTEALIWSLQTMCFFTVKISLLYAAKFNVCSLRAEN